MDLLESGFNNILDRSDTVGSVPPYVCLFSSPASSLSAPQDQDGGHSGNSDCINLAQEDIVLDILRLPANSPWALPD